MVTQARSPTGLQQPRFIALMDFGGVATRPNGRGRGEASLPSQRQRGIPYWISLTLSLGNLIYFRVNPSPSGILFKTGLSIIAGSGENGGSQVQFIPLTFKKHLIGDKNQRAFNVNGLWLYLLRVSLPPITLSPCCRWPGILHPGLGGSHRALASPVAFG